MQNWSYRDLVPILSMHSETGYLCGVVVYGNDTKATIR